MQTFRPQHGLIVYSRNVIEILLCPGNMVRAARSDKGYLRLSMTLLSNKVENIGNVTREDKNNKSHKEIKFIKIHNT